ncbi:protein spaetzle 5 isoform X1 [Cherax quadricarinatus]
MTVVIASSSSSGAAWSQHNPTHSISLPSGGRSSGSSITFLENRNDGAASGRIMAPMLRTKEKPNCASARGPNEGEPCMDDTDYDKSVKDYVSFLIKRNKRLNDLVADPVLSNILNDSPAPVEESVLSTRFGGDLEQESPVCASKETLIYPKRGKTTKDDWVFVVNQENVQQALRVEKCINEGSSCNFGMPLPGNARAVCRQKYVYRRMLTVASNSIDPEEVLMPSCCVCYASKSNFDIAVRILNATALSAGGAATPSALPINAANRATQPLRLPLSGVSNRRPQRGYPAGYNYYG